MVGEAERPNLFELTGAETSVTYSTTSIDGQARLGYQDQHRKLEAVGDEIASQESDLGTLVSVQLEVIPDLHTLSFTLVVPAINLGGTQQPFETFGVRTTSRTSIGGPGVVTGALQHYEVLELSGTAQFAEF